MAAAAPPTTKEVDSIIVGGGPCGLTLARGLFDLGYSVVVIEKDPPVPESHDWSKAYSFRVDVRGQRLLKRLASGRLHEELVEAGIRSEGFKGMNWNPDGSFTARKAMTLGSVGYWIVRPKFLKLLNDAVPDRHKIRGEATDIRFCHGDEGEGSYVVVSLWDGTSVRSGCLFGCDGIQSRVREALASSVDPRFGVEKMDCPSAGLVYRATLYDPPDSLDPMYSIPGKTGERLTMLPFGGKAGELRPLSKADHPSWPWFRAASPDRLCEMLDEEFPQLRVRERLSIESARAWCEGDGSTFPRPRWANRACALHRGVFACILGDALHCYPPDLGQGLNSGMVDVDMVLDRLVAKNNNDKQREIISASAATKLNEELVAEARAVCQLLPIGMPYQYSLPFSFGKVWFFAGFLARIALHRLFSNKKWFHAPAILEIQDDPPKKYATILERHHQGTRRMMSLALLGAAGIASYWLMYRQR